MRAQAAAIRKTSPDLICVVGCPALLCSWSSLGILTSGSAISGFLSSAGGAQSYFRVVGVRSKGCATSIVAGQG